MISEKAERLLVVREGKLEKAIDSRDWYQFIESSFDAATMALDDLRDEARRDLILESSLPPVKLTDKLLRRAQNRSGHSDLEASNAG